MKMKKLLAILFVLAIVCVGALAEGTLTVQGMGVVTVDADRASISLGVRESAKDVMTAQAAVNAKMEAVIAALQDAGAEDGAIATGSIGIYANYDYDDGEQLADYTAYNSVVVTVKDVDRVGALIDAAFAAGANELDYVQFYALYTAEASDEALALAVQAAQERAGTLAAAAGVELGELLEIRDDSTGSYTMDDAFARAKAEDSGTGAVVLPSQQQVCASVTLVYAVSGE